MFRKCQKLKWPTPQGFCLFLSQLFQGVGAGVFQAASASPMTSPTKDVNTASLCCAGQQVVQDIVSKTQEMFKQLKDLQVTFLALFC